MLILRLIRPLLYSDAKSFLQNGQFSNFAPQVRFFTFHGKRSLTA